MAKEVWIFAEHQAGAIRKTTLELLGKGDEAVLSIRNFGDKSLEELREKLQEKGFLRGVDSPAPTVTE